MRRGLVLLVLLLAACGGGKDKAAATRTPAPQATGAATAAPTPKIAIAPGDRPACAALYTRLERVGMALNSASALVAQASNPTDLAAGIATEQTQLERSARLMDSAVVPHPLKAANRRLVASLHRFSRDFGTARAAAGRSDFQAAVSAMTDKVAIAGIVDSAKLIESSCSG